jgi:hypothetical protein
MMMNMDTRQIRSEVELSAGIPGLGVAAYNNTAAKSINFTLDRSSIAEISIA